MKLLFLLFLFASFDAYSGSEIRVAISSAPSNLSPFYATDANSQNINKLIHRSLIEFDRKMNLVCDLCESFEHKVVNNREIIKIKLQKGVTFSDGTLVTSKDVENSIKYFVFDQNIHSIYMTALKNIEKINVIDNENFEIHFREYSEENLINLPVLKIIKLAPKADDILSIKGCGEYVLSTIDPLEITLRSRKRDILIRFKVVKDETTLALKLLNNEIDLSVATIAPRKINWLKQNKKDLKIFMLPSSNFQYLGFNLKNKFLSNKKIREAISNLIPREEIIKHKLKGTAIVSEGMFSPAFSSMYEKIQSRKYNPKLAAELLKSEGFILNKNKIWEKDNLELRFEWKVSNNKSSIEIAEFMANRLLKNGIRIKLVIVEWGTYMSSFKAGNYDLVIGQWIGFSGPDMLKFVYHSESIPPKGGNRFFYENKVVDKLLDLASKELNKKKRISLYKEVETIINSEAVVVNLWHPNIVWLGNDKICQLDLFPSGNFNPLLEMEEDCGK